MKPKEIESSLGYEIEKYIPFKIEELMWDYGHARFPKDRKVSISFVGIKENDLRRFEDILSRLDLKSVVVEPSCLSLVRVIKSVKGLAQLKNFAVLDFTDNEAYLTFFQHDLPVFNRYITIPKKDDGLDLDHFIESVNFSFQYFKREFKTYSLERFIIVGDANTERVASSLKDDVQAQIETLTSYDLTSRNNSSIEGVKALGVANIDSLPYKFKPKLKSVEKPIDQVETPQVPVNIALKRGFLSVVAGLGLIGSIYFYTYLEGDINADKVSVKRRTEHIENVLVPPSLKDLSWDQRKEIVKSRKEDNKTLKKLSDSIQDFSPFLDKLSQRSLLPKGLWLEEVNIMERKVGYDVSLNGSIFLDDDYEERSELDTFIANLQEDEAVKALFTDVNLESSARKVVKGFEVTKFRIKCLNQKDK